MTTGYRCWEIERNTYATEQLQKLDALLASDESAPDMTWLNEKNRKVVMLLLDRIQASGDPKYIPALEAWAQDTFKKVRSRIEKVIEALSNAN